MPAAVLDNGKDVVPQLVIEMQALAHPIRFALVDRLQMPAFLPDLAREFHMTRQAMKKHLDALRALGMVTTQSSRRRALPATLYRTNPAGLFAFKEHVRSLAVHTDPASLLPVGTAEMTDDGERRPRAGPYLLLVHGDVPGRCFALGGRSQWVIGRDARADVAISYDPYASGRHCSIRRDGTTWSVMDLQSTNGTRINFQPMAPGQKVVVRPGDLVMVGRSVLALREET